MKTKILFIITIIFTIVLNSLIIAQTNKLNEGSVFYDYAKFKNDSVSAYVEFYYSIILSALTPSKYEKDSVVTANIDLTIYNDSTNEKLYNLPIKFMSMINSDDINRENKYITGVKSFILNPGHYRFVVDAIDLQDTTNHYLTEFKITIINYEPERISLSSLEICSNIIEGSDNKNSYFYKNTYEVIPNPSLIFGEGLPMLFYYLEVYNLLKGDLSHPVILSVGIRDNQGNLKQVKQKQLSRKFNSIVEVGAFNITKLKSGVYQLTASVIDSVTGNGMVSSKKFFIYNTSIVDTTPMMRGDEGFLSSEFSVMSEEELDDKFAMAKYIASSEEISQWEKLTTLESKRQFLYKFWYVRNPDRLSPYNEAKDRYYERVNLANQRYSSNRVPGWKTDRGRVLLIYGEPSEIERFPNEMDSYPYEIWHYNQLEGGCIFVFGDLTGISQMNLLHSTYRGELRDDNWYNRIKKSR